jgi:hypothetical protein
MDRNDQQNDNAETPGPLGAQVLAQLLDHVKQLRECYDAPLKHLENKRVSEHVRGWLKSLDKLEEDTLTLNDSEYGSRQDGSADQDDGDTDKKPEQVEDVGEDEDVEPTPSAGPGDLEQPSGEDVASGLKLPGKGDPQPDDDDDREALQVRTKALLDQQTADLQKLAATVATLSGKVG